MSYQFELGEVNAASVPTLLEQRVRAYGEGLDIAERDATMDHVVAANGAALLLIGAMGSPPNVRVAVVGHANPGHQPREGYADESITISIGVVRAVEAGDGTQDGGELAQPPDEVPPAQPGESNQPPQ